MGLESRFKKMLLGYNTNGLPHYDLLTAVELLAELGYPSVSISLEKKSLNPYDDAHEFYQQLDGVRDLLERLELKSVIETDSCFMFDDNQLKPTLLASDSNKRAQWIGFLLDAVDIAQELGSDFVHLHSGISDESLSEEESYDRILEGLDTLVMHASAEEVCLALAVRPGTFIDSIDRFEKLIDRLTNPNLHLACDIHCLPPDAKDLSRWTNRLASVRIEENCDDEVQSSLVRNLDDFAAVIDGLVHHEYDGSVYIHRSGYESEAEEAARQALELFVPMVQQV